jgi:hypothetical protein
MHRLLVLLVGAGAMIASGCATTAPSNGCSANGSGGGRHPLRGDGEPGCVVGRCDCARDYNPLDPYGLCGSPRAVPSAGTAAASGSCSSCGSGGSGGGAYMRGYAHTSIASPNQPPTASPLPLPTAPPEAVSTPPREK